MKRLLYIVVALWGLGTTSEVRAEAGTHGIAGFDMGASLSNAPRPTGALQVGAGAKLRGTPLRTYVLGELGYGRWQRNDGDTFERERRDDLSLGVGLRLYVAIPDPLRLHFDLLAGASRADTQLLRNRVRLEAASWQPQVSLAVGLQYRVLRELSLGLRVRALLAKHALDDVRQALRERPRYPVMLLAGVTWHF